MSYLEADFVIVGSGSAGAALAYRLGEDQKHTVILVEYGGSDKGPFIQMPAALSYPMGMSRYDWGFISEPEPHLGNRRFACPRGKVIGGTSSINGMVYVRGHARDFDHWEALGARGWSYAHVLPYFKRMETWHGDASEHACAWRGANGPLHITRGQRRNPLYRAFIEAGYEAGYEKTDDYNGERQEGFGPMEQTVWRGRRWSAANAYLRPALRWENIQLVNGLALRVIFEGKKATGVSIKQGSRIRTIKARREVVLSASSINSPKLLMLSGIGQAGRLQAMGIEVKADRPGVGENLQDHLELYIQQACTQPITLYKYWSVFQKARIGARWLLTKTGLGATNHFESGAFVRSCPEVEYPDIQFHFLPFAVNYDGVARAHEHGFQVHVGPMRSASRGTVRLRSNNPEEAPEIRFNYMSHKDDWCDFRRCIEISRQIFAQKAFDPFRGREIQPGAHVCDKQALDAFIAEHVESAYHPCGTAKMGARDDPMAVVDPECRVIGVDGLRVVDSSVFPRITNGNINAPSILIGEKAADHILGRSLLSP